MHRFNKGVSIRHKNQMFRCEVSKYKPNQKKMGEHLKKGHTEEEGLKG
jgi:hypothetical protein